jgi:hypothetical protein
VDRLIGISTIWYFPACAYRDSSLIFHHQEDVTGIGVVHVRGPLAREGAYLYALTEMRLYDGPSFELIKQVTASLAAGNRRNVLSVGFEWQKMSTHLYNSITT